MKKVGILFSEKSERLDFLMSILKEEYEILEMHNQEDIMILLSKSFDEVSVLLVDRPSNKEYINEVFDFIDKNNSFMFSMPVILLTDKEHIEEDDKYLSSHVVGLVTEVDTERTIKQRIENTIKFANSSSFGDFSDMLTALPCLIYLKDKRGRYAFCSQHWHHLYDKNESIRGKTDFQIRKDPNNARIARESDLEVLNTGKGKNYIIKESDDEGTEYLHIIKEPLKDKKGNVNGIIAIINDVTDEELLRQELRKKSITDQLTGLYNRMYFEEIAQSKVGKLDLPLTIISSDCDDLKVINDKYGHAAGDEYICCARSALQDVLPDKAYIFRMGGDEFLAVVPNTSKEQGAALTNQINEAVKKYKNIRFELKMSVGYFTIENDSVSIERAVAQSDKAMYKNKKERKQANSN